MRIRFDDALPVSQRRDDIAQAIADHQVVVIAGETGSGKTTQIPKIVRAMGRTSIAHTQPRRIAARSVAARIAHECEVELGQEVGYAVRFDDTTSDSTVIKLMTDGLLLAEIHHDRDLRRYDTIIIDEAHERSLSIDFLLGYLKQLLPRRPDLKIVITSATIDVDRFAAMFDAPVLTVSGRTYPVEVRYRPLGDREGLTAIEEAFKELPKDGDVLVFLSGEREIRDTADHLEGLRLPRTEVLPLYGRLAAKDQQKVFATHPGRRIVLATNVAETSITVPGIRYVIDPGLARISRYSQRLKVQRLPIEAISQASANQRAGRCGRVADGICIRLYEEDDFTSRPEFTEPEILRTNLASVLLQMAALDLGAMGSFPFLDPPDSRAIKDGQSLLSELGALRDGRLTKIGRHLSRLPVDPRLARMLVSADRLGCLADVLVIVSAMSIQDPRERPLGKEAEADTKHARFREPDSDFLSYLTLWRYIREKRTELSGSKFRKLCTAEYLHYVRIREWHDVHSQLRQTAKEIGLRPGKAGSDPDLVHQALLPGLLSHLGHKDESGRDYTGARNARFAIFPGSGLARKPPAWIMAGELVETGRLWARTVAKIDPAWVEKAAGHLAKRNFSEPHWSSKRGAVMARERVTVYGLPIVVDRLVGYARIDPALSRELFIRHALVEGDWRTHHSFFAENRELLERIEELEDRVRRRDLRVDDQTVFDFYDARLPTEVVSARHFDAWWKKQRQKRPDLLTMTTEEVLAGSAPDAVDAEFPTSWSTESSDYAISYVFEPGSAEDGTWVDIPLTDLPDLDPGSFRRGVPGRTEELVAALLRSLPKPLRKAFVPVPDHARRLAGVVSDSPDFMATLTEELTRTSPQPVRARDFDWSAVPGHVKVRFRVLDEEEEIARGDDLEELRARLAPRLAAKLRSGAANLERTGLTSWDVGEIARSVVVRGVTGYPALVDEGATVGLKVLPSAEEQSVSMVRAQARLIANTVPSTAKRILDGFGLPEGLALASAPYADAPAVLDDCRLAAIDGLVARHDGPAWGPTAFEAVRTTVRAEVHDETARMAAAVVASMRAMAELNLGSDAASEDVRVQLSWMIYPGFVRDAGVEWLPRIPHYVRAAQRRLTARETADLWATQDLEARFYEAIEGLSPLRRLSSDVARVRWALEELRLSLFGGGVRTAFPVSVKRLTALLTDLESHL